MLQLDYMFDGQNIISLWCVPHKSWSEDQYKQQIINKRFIICFICCIYILYEVVQVSLENVST